MKKIFIAIQAILFFIFFEFVAFFGILEKGKRKKVVFQKICLTLCHSRA